MTINPIETCLTREGLALHGNACLERAQQLRKELQTLATDEHAPLTWESTFAKLDAISDALMSVSGIASLMAVTHPDAKIRAAAETWDPHITNFLTELYLDTSLAALFGHAAVALTPLTEAHAIFVEDTLREFKRNGLNLSPEKQTRLKEINETLTKLGQEFERNLASTTLSLEVSPQDLDGLPETFIASHAVNAHGIVTITTNTSDYVPFMKYCKNRAVARELYILSKIRCKETNLPILDKLLALRFEKKNLLGYPTWADYVLEPRMAKNATTVAAFLKDLQTGIQPGIKKDLEILKEVGTQTTISIADVGYLEELANRTKFALDSQRVSEYFEFNNTLAGFQTVASKLFGIEFRSVEAQVWHPDVHPLDIHDADGTLLGRIYLDLHPRTDKYKHAAEFPIRTTQRLSNGTRATPICSLVCNFAKPGEHPSLLTHGEVTTLFHEFGHALHEILSQAELTSQAGTRVAWDFVEVPSQLLEEFAWSYDTLSLFAKHYKTGEPLPHDLHDAMLHARSFGKACDTAQQLFYAALDQAYHTKEPGYDTNDLREQLLRDYLPFEPIPGTYFQATFGHLVNYDAGYYSYQWALAIAKDLLTRFQQDGMLNPQTASDYRKMILEPGGSQDEGEMVEKFLGRKRSLEAYKKFLGVNI